MAYSEIIKKGGENSPPFQLAGTFALTGRHWLP